MGTKIKVLYTYEVPSTFNSPGGAQIGTVGWNSYLEKNERSKKNALILTLFWPMQSGILSSFMAAAWGLASDAQQTLLDSDGVRV